MNKKLYTAIFLSLALLVFHGSAVARPDGARNFVTHLEGEQEVPPRVTAATGQAVFQLSEDGMEIRYRLIVANIENVTASHIHLGGVGVNGMIVVFLAGPFPVGGGRTDGVLAAATFTKDDLIGPLEGQELSVLVEAMRTGGTYVNVHTNDGVDPTNTGPGDFPGGEIRGQIRPAGMP